VKKGKNSFRRLEASALLHPSRNRYGLILDQNLDLTRAAVLLKYEPYTDLKVQEQRFELILPPLCAKWDIHPVRLTQTCG
jgi:hypothetical protein